mgnify:CR=1 FL=1
MIEKVLGGIAAAGIVGTVSAAVLSPYAMSPVLACTGGAMGATAACMVWKKNDEEKVDEANRVSNAFNYLYEVNKGIVAPTQLSVLSAVPLDRIENFLDQLVKDQGGNLIGTSAGNIASFPHPVNALQEMTNNATAWAQNQTEQLAAENQQLQQKLALINAARMAQPAGRQAPPVQQATNGVAQKSNPVEPWNNLL